VEGLTVVVQAAAGAEKSEASWRRKRGCLNHRIKTTLVTVTEVNLPYCLQQCVFCLNFTGSLERWLVPHTCQCWRGIWTVPLTTCADLLRIGQAVGLDDRCRSLPTERGYSILNYSIQMRVLAPSYPRSQPLKTLIVSSLGKILKQVSLNILSKILTAWLWSM